MIFIDIGYGETKSVDIGEDIDPLEDMVKANHGISKGFSDFYCIIKSIISPETQKKDHAQVLAEFRERAKIILEEIAQLKSDIEEYSKSIPGNNREEDIGDKEHLNN